MKIDDCLKKLQDSENALQSAPEKGFVDLDKIKDTLSRTRAIIEQITPRLELGERLIEDTRKSLLSRLNVLKQSGGGALVSQAEQYLQSDNLDYDKLKALQHEITESINAIFGGFSRHTIKLNHQAKPPAKPEDYRS